MDIIITIGLIYLAYRAYSWYTAMQAEVKADSNLREVPEEPEPETFTGFSVRKDPEPLRDDDDYIDYEEVK